MNKNIIWISLIFIVPLVAYYGLVRESVATQSANAVVGDEIIKFASPMCYECSQLEQVVEKVFPKYENRVVLSKIDVTKKDKNTRELIRKYNVTLVPTTVFKNQNGKITRRIEGNMQPEVFESYTEELINE